MKLRPLAIACASAGVVAMAGASFFNSAAPVSSPLAATASADHPHYTRAAFSAKASRLPQRRAVNVDKKTSQRFQNALSANSKSANVLTAQNTQISHVFTNPQGRTVVHFDQMIDGVRVWGARGVAHLNKNGSSKVIDRGLSLMLPKPQNTTRLSGEQARHIALNNFRAKGEVGATDGELMVFPSRYTGGIRLKNDTQTRQTVIDRDYSIFVAPPKAESVYAYQVTVLAKNKQDGLAEVRYVIDADTGTILRKDNELKTARTPIVGTGHSQYSGEVSINTLQEEDGSYTMQDGVNGTAAHPLVRLSADKRFLLPWSEGYDEAEPIVGNLTLSETHEGDYGEQFNDRIFVNVSDNVWGDGEHFSDWPNELTTNGQTAGVDAHYGMATTWTMLRNVFNWAGIDGNDSSAISEVHIRNPYTGANFDNAYWSDFLFGMFYGDGSYNGDTLVPLIYDCCGEPNPMGFQSLTEIDVVGHELGHGVTGSTAALTYAGESGGLNEGSSDIMGSLVEAYAKRSNPDANTIPPTGTDWKMGVQMSPGLMGPLRSLINPWQQDHLSANEWYEGMQWLDVHYSSGPINRMFYFLAMGAPTDSTSEAYSAYLPNGMTGIGMDSAARIWFKALTEYMTAQDQYAEAREAFLASAVELYGEGSVQHLAVKSAFAAINVGEAEGEAPRTKVTFPVIRPVGHVFGNEGSSASRMQYFPIGVTASLNAEVQNNDDKRLVWKPRGSFGDFANPIADPTGAGRISNDNQWTTPLRSGWWVLTAQSKADPRAYAEGMAMTLNLDTDLDGQQDAIDMGMTALSWYLSYSLHPSDSPYGGPWVEDMDAAFFVEAINTAWGKK